MMIAVYRVAKENHNTQYFLFRKEAELFAEDKNANWDIVYRNTIDEANKLCNNKLAW